MIKGVAGSCDKAATAERTVRTTPATMIVSDHYDSVAVPHVALAGMSTVSMAMPPSYGLSVIRFIYTA